MILIYIIISIIPKIYEMQGVIYLLINFELDIYLRACYEVYKEDACTLSSQLL